jgi:3-oxoacyl-[acyl-carrier protein] reductase
LENQVAVVTGAASGLGRATATHFAREGARVILADLDRAGGQTTVDAVRREGGTATFVPTDVRRVEEVENLARVAREQDGRIDVFINCAGAAPYGRVEHLSDEAWHLAIDTSLTGAFHCCRALLPTMLARRSGTIVLVGSLVVRGAPAHYAAHVAAKSGLLGLARALANGVREQNVAVFALCPGFIDSPMGWQGFREIYGSEPTAEEKRRMLQPDDLAEMILRLLDPALRPASGTVLDVPAPRI